MTYRWLFCFWKDASNEPIHAVEFTRKSEDCNKTHMRIKAIFAFFSTLLMSVPLFVVITAYGSHTFRCRSISISHLFPPFMSYIRGTCTGCSLNIEFFLKMFWFFWTLSVLLQCWCLTCPCVHTVTPMENRERPASGIYIKIFEKIIFNEHPVFQLCVLMSTVAVRFCLLVLS